MCPHIDNFIISFSVSNNALFMFIKNSFNFFISFSYERFFFFRNNHICIANRKSTCGREFKSCILQVIKESGSNFISKLHKHLTDKSAECFFNEELVKVTHFFRNYLIKNNSTSSSFYHLTIDTDFNFCMKTDNTIVVSDDSFFRRTKHHPFPEISLFKFCQIIATQNYILSRDNNRSTILRRKNI